MMEEGPTKDQFTGCLLGQCLGDALGFMLEGQPPETCEWYVSKQMAQMHHAGLRRGSYSFGQYSDDSQLARELLRSLLETQGFDPADYAQRISRLFAEERVVGGGFTTGRAAQHLAAGIPWHRSGLPAPLAGNGSAMRAAPLGLWFYHDHEGLLRAARDQSLITHADPRCLAGSIVVAGTVAGALTGENTGSLLGRLSSWTAPHDAVMTSALLCFPEWLEAPPDQTARWILSLGEAGAYGEGWRGVSPFVTHGVLWSLYSYLRSPDDPWEVLRTAIRVGGDVDTTAAMAGAMVGARMGQGALPREQLNFLNDGGEWRLWELIDLAEQAYSMVMDRAAHAQEGPGEPGEGTGHGVDPPADADEQPSGGLLARSFWRGLWPWSSEPPKEARLS